MNDFVIEIATKSGVVKQEIVSVNQTELRLNCNLAGIDGPLERATLLQKLYVHRTLDAFPLSYSYSYLFSHSLVHCIQLNANALVDVPACVLTLTQVTFLDVRLLPFVVRLLTTHVQLDSNHLLSLPSAIGQMMALTTLSVRHQRVCVHLCLLTNAIWVQLSDNHLVCLPHEIGLLRSLRELRVSFTFKCAALPCLTGHGRS
jgi:Leucine-rich repeat (LRR) protein